MRVLTKCFGMEPLFGSVELEAVLAVALLASYNVGRVAIAVRRLLGAIESEEAVKRLEEASILWMRNNAAGLGKFLSLGDPDSTGYALGAVLAGPPWHDLAVELWDKLLGPWLNA